MIARKKLVSAINLVLVAALLGFTGCSGNPGEPDTSAAGAGTASEETTSGGAGSKENEGRPDRTAIEIIGDCLKERGWDVEVNVGQQGIFVELHDSQTKRYREDYAACDVYAGAENRPFAAIPEEELQYEYDAWSEIQDCLVAEGYPVPEKPSYESWKDSLRDGDISDIWYLYQEAEKISMNQAETEAMYNKCPTYGGYFPSDGD